MQKLLTILVTAVVAVVFLFSGAASAQQAKAKPWDVPANVKAVKSPVNLKDPAVINNGKDLWAKNCKACHGAKGLGDGPRAASLKTNPGDFSSAAFQNMTDGEIHYKTMKGRDEMPAYEKKITEASDQWALIAFMRTLKK